MGLNMCINPKKNSLSVSITPAPGNPNMVSVSRDGPSLDISHGWIHV